MGIISISLPADGSTADVADVNTPLTTIKDAINGNLDNANISASAAIAGSKLQSSSIDLGTKASQWDGWIAVSDTWAYASATTATAPSDATTKYSVGDKVKFTQTSVKYFYITAVSSTTITLSGGSDYTVANAAISSIYYSKAATPLSFPAEFSWAPTWTNLSVGNGTLTGKFYLNAIKEVSYRLRLVFGSTTAISGAVSFTLPINAHADYQNAASTNFTIGTATLVDAGTNTFGGRVLTSSTAASTGIVKASNSTGTYEQFTDLSSTGPHTWALNDEILLHGSYEAA